jgi:recombination protein RecT
MAETRKDLILRQSHTNLQKLLQMKAAALPKDFNETRFVQNCMTVLQDTSNIDKCDPVSVARTMLKGAFLGLDFFNRECYAIPYGNSLQFQTDYKGEKKMAKKYSIRPIKDIYAKVVREGDEFEERIENGTQIINFTPKAFNNGNIIGAFAVVLYEDGGMDYETMTTEQIEGIKKNFSKAPNSTMWKNVPEEAYKKTVLRRLCKHIEKDFASIEQQKTFEESSDFEFESKTDKPKEKSPFDTTEAIEVNYTTDEELTEEQEKQISFEGTPFGDDE